MPSKCLKCGKRRTRSGDCGCPAVRRGWGKSHPQQTDPKPGGVVVNAAHKGTNLKWCAVPGCGCLLRNGVCSNVTCGRR